MATYDHAPRAEHRRNIRNTALGMVLLAILSTIAGFVATDFWSDYAKQQWNDP